jgi:hypothetical protein
VQVGLLFICSSIGLNVVGGGGEGGGREIAIYGPNDAHSTGEL